MNRTTCRDCDKQLSARAISRPNSTGYCRACAPKHHWTPASRARASAARSDRWARELSDPDLRAKAVASGKRLSEKHPPDRARVERQIAGRRASHWLPEGYEELNATLKRKGCKVDERKVMIAEEVARVKRKAIADEQARLGRMTPFERMQDAVARGVTLITKPDLRKASSAFTMGGVVGEIA